MVCSSPVTWSATGSSSPAAGADLYKRLRKTAAEETRLRKINFLKKILCFPSYSVKYVLVMVTEVHVKHGETFKLTRSAYEINADSVSGSFFSTLGSSQAHISTFQMFPRGSQSGAYFFHTGGQTEGTSVTTLTLPPPGGKVFRGCVKTQM